MTEIEQAIDILSDFNKQVKVKAGGAYEYTKFIEAKRLAIAALREKEERSVGCPLCHMDNRYYHFAGNPPNFCKNCGADMREKRP